MLNLTYTCFLQNVLLFNELGRSTAEAKESAPSPPNKKRSPLEDFLKISLMENYTRVASQDRHTEE